MDLSDLTRSVVSTLDGAVLAVLAQAGRPLTVAEVSRLVPRGSEIGVRRSLGRLALQGIVRTTAIGRSQAHELNRDHVAAPVAELLAGLRSELWRRLRRELGAWRIAPVRATVFGSAARGDGGPDSDVDLLLVRGDGQTAPGSRRGARASKTGELGGSVADQVWERQVDRLRNQVEAWTGNRLQVVEMTVAEYEDARAHKAKLVAEVDRDGIELVERAHSRARLAAGA